MLEIFLVVLSSTSPEKNFKNFCIKFKLHFLEEIKSLIYSYFITQYSVDKIWID